MRRWKIAAVLCGLCLSAVVPAQNASVNDTYPGAIWGHADGAEAANWSAAKLGQADAYAKSMATSSYLVAQHGKIVHEYGDTAQPVNLQSMRKSVLSVLVGMYVDRGAIRLDSTLAQLGIDDKGGLTAQEKTATFQQLLQGRSGVYHPGALEAIAFAGPRPERGSFKPDEHFYYNNWDFNAVGLAFAKLAGKSVPQSLHDDLAVPLQMENFNATADVSFVTEEVSNIPAYVIRLSARDMARIGLLMSRDGSWGGKQLVSTSWVAGSTTSYSEMRPGSLGFGYMWFVGFQKSNLSSKLAGRRRFAAIGSNGQEMIVVPDLDLVIVHNVDSERFPERSMSEMDVGRLMTKIVDAME